MTRQDIATLAMMMCDLIDAQLTPEQFADVQAGENPQDIIDANSAVYGAWCCLHFEEPDPRDQATADAINTACALCHRLAWDRNAIKALR
mgnify:FL=1|tara:strand:- start:38 stop:307 length:270 start_codon:yes stop_codon:yes gene_type:complete